jgi:hypothetical protein
VADNGCSFILALGATGDICFSFQQRKYEIIDNRDMGTLIHLFHAAFLGTRQIRLIENGKVNRGINKESLDEKIRGQPYVVVLWVSVYTCIVAKAHTGQGVICHPLPTWD